jgi:hypothetical protein
MRPRRRRRWVGFALFAVLAVLGLAVFDGAAAAGASLAAMLTFIGACMYALRSEDPESVDKANQTGITGWFGGWW